MEGGVYCQGSHFSSNYWVSQKSKLFFPPQAVIPQQIQYYNLILLVINLRYLRKKWNCVCEYNEYCSKQIIFFFFSLHNKIKNNLVASAFKNKSICGGSSQNLRIWENNMSEGEHCSLLATLLFQEPSTLHCCKVNLLHLWIWALLGPFLDDLRTSLKEKVLQSVFWLSKWEALG